VVELVGQNGLGLISESQIIVSKVLPETWSKEDAPRDSRTDFHKW